MASGEQSAKRFAEALLQDNLAPDGFEVAFLDGTNMRSVADALRELGCSVEENPLKQLLFIKPPLAE